MASCMQYLQKAMEHQASDVFFVAGKQACEQLDGHMRPLDEARLLPADTGRLLQPIYTAAGRDMAHFVKTGDDDFSFSVPGLARFRVNTYRQRGSMAAVIRLVSFDIPDWKQLLPDVSGGMIPACEILQVNNAVRSMIRDNKNHQIDNTIASGSRDGMISMDQAIAKLYKEGRVSQEVALLYADKPEQLKRQL